MFGLLPEYLQSLGYKTFKDSTISPETLQQSRILVVINLNEKLTLTEKKLIQTFVHEGGSLLVLGDHTGLGGIMEPLNELLKFTDIQFNFDSAHYLKDGWLHAYELRPHPITLRIRDEDDIGISVGASLRLPPLKASPIIVAKYGFSDAGDPLAKDNAYLGDRRYNDGELLGDIILVAEAYYGKGKVLVFGDTSSFQNGTLPQDFAFIAQVFQWLSQGKLIAQNELRVILGLLLLLMAILVMVRFGHIIANPTVVMICFGTLFLGLVGTQLIESKHF